MSTYYLKVRPYVAKRLGILSARARYADSSVRLWAIDLSMVDRGYGFRMAQTAARIGAVLLDPYAAYDESLKSKEQCTPMPLPTDEAWMPWPDEIAEGLALDLGGEIAEEEAVEEAIEEAAEEIAEAEAAIEEAEEAEIEEAIAEVEKELEEEGGES